MAIDPPSVLPLFPLTGVLLLPGMWLPFNIFEPRYLNMVHDAMEEGRHIGMIQPVTPRQDNRPSPGAELEMPELYPVGCAGLIEGYKTKPGEKILIQLRGVCRFRIKKELELHRGYRRAEPNYEEFREDRTNSSSIEGARLLDALTKFTQAMGIDVKREMWNRTPAIDLLNGLSMWLPFNPAEKQALLEAPGIPEREEMLYSLLTMGAQGEPKPTGPMV